MLVSPSRQGADYNFHRDRKATRTERYQTYDLYTQAKHLPTGNSDSSCYQQIAEEVMRAIRQGTRLDTTPEELLLTDREKVRGQECRGHSVSAQDMAAKITDGIRQSKSLNDLWERANEFEQEGAKDLRKDALYNLSKSPLIDLNQLLVNALRKKHSYNVKPLVELGANPNLLLKIAAIQGEIELIEPLLEAGAEVNHTNRKGWNATTLAARLGQDQSLKRLKEKNGYNDFSRILAEEIIPDLLKNSEKHQKLAMKKLLGEVPLGIHFPETLSVEKSLDMQA